MAKILTSNGQISSSAPIDIKIGVSSSLYIGSSSIGIGTTTPDSALDIEIGYITLPELAYEPETANITPGKGALYISGADSKIYFKNDLGDVFDLTVNGGLIEGDITAVYAGTNLTGGGISGNVTLSLTSSITGGLNTITGVTTISSSNIAAGYLTASNIDTDWVDFNLNPAIPTQQEGRLFYDSASNELSYWSEISGVNLNIGHQLAQRVQNESGITLNKGQIVHIISSSNPSDTPRVTTASYENDANSAGTLGVLMTNVLNGERTYALLFGVLTGIDTTGYYSGQPLYLSSSGNFSSFKPQAPLHDVRIGNVVRHQSVNGSIFVRVQNGYELDEIHDVRIINKQNGDLLTYNSANNVWINSTNLSGSYSISGNLTVTGSTILNNLSGNTAEFTTISGSTITGSTGLFTTISGSTVTGSTALFTTISGSTITGSTGLFAVVSGSTITGSTGLFAVVSGSTITGSTGLFTTISGSTITGSTGLFTTISGSTVTGSTALFAVVSGSTITGSTGLFAVVSGSTITGSTGLFTVVSGSTITGSTALFTTISGNQGQFVTASAFLFVGDLNGTASNSNLLDGLDSTAFVEYVDLPDVAVTSIVPGSGLSGTLALSGAVTLNVVAGDGISTASDSVAVDGTVVRTTGDQTISGVKNFTSPITGTYAYFTNNLIVNGTASIGQLNTLQQSSLVIGDKYITILSGGVDHTTLDGSGILWGSGSTGPTVNELGANAHVRYRSSIDSLEVFPGLYVSGSASVSGGLNVTGSTTVKSLSGTVAQFTSVTSSFSGSYAGDGGNLINISRKLINYINNGPAEEYTSSYLEITPTDSVFPVSSIWYTDATKTKKIYEEFYQISGSGTAIKPNPITYKLYKQDGITVLIQATDTITYTSYGASNISRSISSSYY